MAAEEIDVIRHLIDVEREASGLVLEAQKKADALINDARAKSDEEFRNSYSKLIEETEGLEKASAEKINLKHNSEIEGYRKALSDLKKDDSAFRSVLNSILFA